MDEPSGTVLSGRYLTVEEFAVATGVSLATARRQAAALACGFVQGNGIAAAVKVGRQWLVRVSNS